MKLFNTILNCLSFFLQKRIFSMSCARLDYLQCLKLIIKIMCINPVSFSPSRFYFRKRKKKTKKEKDIITWK